MEVLEVWAMELRQLVLMKPFINLRDGVVWIPTGQNPADNSSTLLSH